MTASGDDRGRDERLGELRRAGGDRLAELQREMAARGVGVCVVGPTDDLRWLVGYDAMALERLTALVVSQSGAAMILPDFDAAEFADVPGRPPAVPWADRTGPAAAVKEAFAHVGSVDGGALVDDELPFAFYALVRDRLPGEAAPASALLGELRMRKSDEELERMARVGELVSRAIDLAQEIAEPGMTERQLERQIAELLWDGGADRDIILVQAGANAATGHHDADETVLRAGEPVLFDISARLDGYWADTTQQVFLGEVPGEYRAHYELVQRAQEAGVRAAVVGATAHDVAEAASRPIVDAGLAEFTGPRTGHGIGVSIHEPPSVIEGDRTELVAGMVITVEPGVYFPGRYGIRIEDTVAVTAAGPRRLTRGARELARKPL
jgi:Xaa-Pro aminopeptidase